MKHTIDSFLKLIDRYGKLHALCLELVQANLRFLEETSERVKQPIAIWYETNAERNSFIRNFLCINESQHIFKLFWPETKNDLLEANIIMLETMKGVAEMQLELEHLTIADEFE